MLSFSEPAAFLVQSLQVPEEVKGWVTLGKPALGGGGVPHHRETFDIPFVFKSMLMLALIGINTIEI